MNVAKITKTFGEAGAVVVRLYEGWSDEYADRVLAVEADGLQVPLFVENFERRGQSGAVVRFADVDTVRRAEMLLGLELSVEEADESEDDHTYIYMSEIVGWEARFEGREELGRIAEFVDSRTNPLFVIDVEGRELLVPAVEEFIVQTGKNFIIFSLPEGLFELN